MILGVWRAGWRWPPFFTGTARRPKRRLTKILEPAVLRIHWVSFSPTSAVTSGGFAAVAGDFKGAINDRGAMFAAYIACRHMGLRDLFSGSQMVLQAHVDRHHILPRAQFPERVRTKADTIANIAFISGEVNRSIGAASPDVYLEKLSTEVLESQCIPSTRVCGTLIAQRSFGMPAKSCLLTASTVFFERCFLGGASMHRDSAERIVGKGSTDFAPRVRLSYFSRLLKNFEAQSAADKRRLTPIENKEVALSYPCSWAFIGCQIAFFQQSVR